MKLSENMIKFLRRKNNSFFLYHVISPIFLILFLEEPELVQENICSSFFQLFNNF